jgi:hypothetical protein
MSARHHAFLFACLALLSMVPFCRAQSLIEQTLPVDIDRFVTNPEIRITHEINAKASYVSDANTKLYGNSVGDISEIHSAVDYVCSPDIVSKEFLPRFGASWERFGFDHNGPIPLPNTLQSAAAIIGFDATLSEDWLLRFEAKPGIYSDFRDVDTSDVNVPFIIGASWLVDSDLQLFAGLSVDLFREYPVLPGAGIRWQFSEDWTLMLVPPEPRVIYSIDKNLQVYTGLDIKGLNARVSNSFGDSIGRPDLNNALINLTEIRAGAGVTYKVLGSIALNLEGGYMVYRRYDFYRANFNLSSEPAPYVQMSVNGSF